MNRILFESTEIVNDTVTFGGVRAEHVLKVLHGAVGQTLKTGEIDGLIGTSTITLIKGDVISVACNHKETSLMPWVDLILAPPRPRVLKRLLPQLASLGVGRIYLVGAKRVEKDFWGATLLNEANYRPLLIDGLMQAGCSIMPKIECRRNFRKFVREEVDSLFADFTKVVAHPYQAEYSVEHATIDHRLCLAIGPEGGWLDEEVALLNEHNFHSYSLGERILRTDTATIALLAKFLPKECR